MPRHKYDGVEVSRYSSITPEVGQASCQVWSRHFNLPTGCAFHPHVSPPSLSSSQACRWSARLQRARYNPLRRLQRAAREGPVFLFEPPILLAVFVSEERFIAYMRRPYSLPDSRALLYEVTKSRAWPQLQMSSLALPMGLVHSLEGFRHGLRIMAVAATRKQTVDQNSALATELPLKIWFRKTTVLLPSASRKAGRSPRFPPRFPRRFPGRRGRGNAACVQLLLPCSRR